MTATLIWILVALVAIGVYLSWTAGRLDRLHARIDATARTWKRRSIVTFHNSMGYYAARYGLTIAAVIEPFPGREPTARYVAEVLAAVRKAKPAALFSEPQLARHPAEVIAAQAKLLALTSLLFWVGATTAGRLMAYIGPGPAVGLD